MQEYIYLEVEENENCDYMPLQVYEPRTSPVPISKVRLFEIDRRHGVYDVTGWDSIGSGSPTQAMYTAVSDSGQAEVHLVYGGDWGIRFKPSDSKNGWDINASDQWGEPYILLTDPEDVILTGDDHL